MKKLIIVILACLFMATPVMAKKKTLRVETLADLRGVSHLDASGACLDAGGTCTGATCSTGGDICVNLADDDLALVIPTTAGSSKFIYDTASVAVDDDDTVVRPTSVTSGAGRWLWAGGTITEAERTKVGYISVTQAVDLDAVETAVSSLSGLNAATGATLINKGAIADSTSIGLDPGDNYSNFATVSDDTVNEMFAAVDTAFSGLPGGHDAVTLDANADAVMSVTSQEVGLDTQTANTVLAGPTSGGAAVPTMRALVDSDIPDGITVNNAATADAFSTPPSPCGAGEYFPGINSSGNSVSCTDATTEINSVVSTHNNDTTSVHGISDTSALLTSSGDGSGLSGVLLTGGTDSIKDTHVDWGTGATQVSGADIPLDVTNFDTNLSATDTTVQTALETLDEMVAGAASVEDAAFDNTWNADTDGASKNAIYDRIHLFDADDDGDFTNEAWFPSTSGAPTSATYITQVAEAGLSAEQALADLATGLVKNTTETGVLSIAAAGTDYLAPGGDGSALTSVDAATGDSATAFFDAGTIEHERGGLEADVSAYGGLVKISGGATSAVTDNSANWNSAYNHSVSVGTDHTYLGQNVSSGQSPILDGTNITGVASVDTADTVSATTYVGLYEGATGAQAPKTDAGLTYNATTGIIGANGISGNAATASALVADPDPCGANTWATDVNAAGDLTCGAVTYAGITAMSSSNLAGIITNESGTGPVLFGTNPTITTPTLTLEDGNGSAPTADGQAKYDRTAEVFQVGDGTTTKAFTPNGGSPTFGTVTANLTGNVTLGAGQDLTGSATSDIAINTDKFTVSGSTGDVGVGGVLTVAGMQDTDNSATVPAASSRVHAHETTHPAPTTRDERNQIAGSYLTSESDPSVDTSSEIVTIINTTPTTLIADATIAASITRDSEIPSLETDPAFTASEAATFVAGDKSVLDSALQPGDIGDTVAAALGADDNYVTDAQVTALHPAPTFTIADLLAYNFSFHFRADSDVCTDTGTARDELVALGITINHISCDTYPNILLDFNSLELTSGLGTMLVTANASVALTTLGASVGLGTMQIVELHETLNSLGLTAAHGDVVVEVGSGSNIDLAGIDSSTGLGVLSIGIDYARSITGVGLTVALDAPVVAVDSGALFEEYFNSNPGIWTLANTTITSGYLPMYATNQTAQKTGITTISRPFTIEANTYNGADIGAGYAEMSICLVNSSGNGYSIGVGGDDDSREYINVTRVVNYVPNLSLALAVTTTATRNVKLSIPSGTAAWTFLINGVSKPFTNNNNNTYDDFTEVYIWYHNAYSQTPLFRLLDYVVTQD